MECGPVIVGPPGQHHRAERAVGDGSQVGEQIPGADVGPRPMRRGGIGDAVGVDTFGPQFGHDLVRVGLGVEHPFAGRQRRSQPCSPRRQRIGPVTP